MKHFHYFLLLAFTFLYSCKKDNQGDGKCKVTSIGYTFNSQIHSDGIVNYDEHGNLSGMTSSSEATFPSFSLEYLQDTVKIFSRENDYIYPLNAQGKVTKVLFQAISFNYGSDGFIESMTIDRDRLKFSYHEGNLVKITQEKYLPYLFKTTFTFTYNLNEKAVDLLSATNPLYYSLPHPILLPNTRYFGNTSKNQLKSVEILTEDTYYQTKQVSTYNLSYKTESKKITSLHLIENILGKKSDKLYDFKYECE
ncbi:hypothetical protein [Pedobacter frigoris]|uniref:hypothetical protein n=1 Tax=Pedobacter frigoris TaxID=2571272 RepID=UPI002931A440|nr:hypothetical protein [Pedobacter frigoris]